MPNLVRWIVLIYFALCSAVANGAEKLVRLEFSQYRKSDPRDVDRKAFQEMMPALGKAVIEKFGLERVEEESLELKVTVGESFYAKSRVANKTITVRGKLVAKPNSPDFELIVHAVNKTHTGNFIPLPNGKRDEITNQFSVDTTATIEKEGTIAIGGLTSVNVNEHENNISSELNYQMINATLADVPDAE